MSNRLGLALGTEPAGAVAYFRGTITYRFRDVQKSDDLYAAMPSWLRDFAEWPAGKAASKTVWTRAANALNHAAARVSLLIEHGRSDEYVRLRTTDDFAQLGVNQLRALPGMGVESQRLVMQFFTAKGVQLREFRRWDWDLSLDLLKAEGLPSGRRFRAL